MSKDLKKVAVYARVSTSKIEQLSSFENQKAYYEAKLSKENGYDLVKMYADEGRTGTSLKREGFMKMLHDAGLDVKINKNEVGSIKNTNTVINYFVSDRKPKFDYIFVKNSSRLARTLDIISVIEKLRQKGVYIHFEDLGRSTENTTDDLVLSILSSVDANFSKDLSAKVLFGNRVSASKGKIRLKELYGYDFNKEENTLRVISEEAEIVKKIFELRANKKGSKQIYNYLKENGIKTRRGGDFLTNAITRMLQNPIYCGKVTRNKWDCRTVGVGQSRILKPREEWIVQETDRIDRIIDDELFDKVQELIKQSTAPNIGKGKYQGRTEFASKIYCDVCGAKYTKNSEIVKSKDGTKIKREWYNCGTKKRDGVSACNSKNIQLLDLEKEVEKYLAKGYYKKYTKALLKECTNALEKEQDNIKNREINDEEITRLNDELELLNSKMQKLIDSFLDSDDESENTKMIFNNTKTKIDTKIKNIEKHLMELNRSVEDRDRLINEIKGMIKFISFIADSIPDKIDREKFIDEEIIMIKLLEEDNIFIYTRSHLIYSQCIEAIKSLYEIVLD